MQPAPQAAGHSSREYPAVRVGESRGTLRPRETVYARLAQLNAHGQWIDRRPGIRPITPGVARSRVPQRREHGHRSPPDRHPADASCRRCALLHLETRPAAKGWSRRRNFSHQHEISPRRRHLFERQATGSRVDSSFSAGTIPALRRRCAPTVGARLGSGCLSYSAPAPAARRLPPRPAPSTSACLQRPSLTITVEIRSRRQTRTDSRC